MGTDRPFPSEAWLEAGRRRWNDPVFSPARVALEANCVADLALRLAVPDRRAGHYHDYFCPEHAVQLTFDPDDDGRHACPVDGRLHDGGAFDDARLWLVNNRLSTAAVRLSVRSSLQPTAADAAADRAWVRDVLIRYAETFEQLGGVTGGLDEYPGVLGFSGLDESIWLVRMSWAYGLISAWLPTDERSRIRSRLLEPMATHLSAIRCPANWSPIDNIAVWNDAAQIVTAVVLGDEARLEQALDQPLGLRNQLSEGVRPYGLWWEGSLSYHFYTLAATIWAIRTLLAAGRTFADMHVVRSMFRAPIGLALPDLTLPAMNDGWYDIGLRGPVGHDIPDAVGFYETGAGWFNDPEISQALGKALRGRSRDSLEALLDGSISVPSDPGDERRPWRTRVLRARSVDMAASGLVVLRAPGHDQVTLESDDETVAIVKAGGSGGSHGHPDQLALQLYAAGTRLLDDLGTSGYGIALSETWYRATASHNTIVIDGQSQPLTDGRISSRRDGKHAQTADGFVAWSSGPDAGPYAGVTARRQAALTPEYLLDFVVVECDRPRTIDWVALPNGGLVRGPGGLASVAAELGPGAGYAHVSDVRLLKDPQTRLSWTAPGGAFLDIELGSEVEILEERLFVGTAPANPPARRLGVLVRRRTATRTRFVAVLQPRRRASVIREIAWPPDVGDGDLVDITTDRGVDSWLVDNGRLRLRSV